MKIYKIEGGTFRAGPGAALLLTKAQAILRAHRLTDVRPCGAAVLATALEVLDFKAGEVIGLGSVDKSMAHLLVEVDKPEAETDGQLLTDAVSAMGDLEAVVKAHRRRR